MQYTHKNEGRSKHRESAAKKPCEWFRRVLKAAEQCVKWWFVSERSNQQINERLRCKLRSKILLR